MALLVETDPAYARLFKPKQKISLLEMMKKKKEGESEVETMKEESKGKKVVKTKAMPKKPPAFLQAKHKASEEPVAKRQKMTQEEEKRETNPKWLIRKDEGSRRPQGCFFCGNDDHKAMYCPKMGDEATALGAKIPSMDERKEKKAGLFCKYCFLLHPGNPKPDLAGWGARTHQKCWYRGDGAREEAKFWGKKEKAGKKENEEEIEKMVQE